MANDSDISVLKFLDKTSVYFLIFLDAQNYNQIFKTPD